MITGHLGVAAGAGSARRDLSLVWLALASVAPDIVDVGFALVSVCNPYGLYSHSLPAATLIAAVLGGVAYLATGRPSAGLITALVVLLHLPLDLVTGRKLYWPGGELLGLQWYTYHRQLDLLAEVLLVAGGWWAIRRSPCAPRWATSMLTLGALVAGQALFDLSPLDLKPTGCAVPGSSLAAHR